ncbi:hypothetical protein NP493_1266g00011 [Ridgeia piscesae]|uniref:Uncharacterized protein n=1 Tax=Ridgeia piscesae TaxID=27915 RepID=A0AAD9KBK0_RIDPI|nr:hypothetical protein NP493_1266g00011 [Ridgeia piscesae]
MASGHWVEALLRTICCLVLSLATGAIGSDTFVPNKLMHSSHRVLLVKHQILTIGRVQAISAYMLIASPVRVQLWRSIGNVTYILDWQKELSAPQFFGRNVVTLDEEEWFDVTPYHRLGIFSEVDPGPILYGVADVPMVVLSASRFPDGATSPQLGSMQTFDQLELPIRFAVDVCNTTGTLRYGINRNGINRVQETEIFNERMLLGCIVWLIILSIVLITVVLILVCIHLRPRRKEGITDVPGELFMVIEDQPDADTTSDRPVTPVATGSTRF